jgi:hypothetical protein
MLAARPRPDHRRTAAAALALIVLALASTARAQDAWAQHGHLWFGADFALAPVGRYTRELSVPQAHDRRSRGGSLAASFFYVGEGPLGIGAHVAPTMSWISLPDIDGRVLTIDIGVSPLARLAWPQFELILRAPIGLSTGRLNWVRERDERLSNASGNNDLGLGMHVGPVLGGVLWLGDFVGLRLETGVMFRRMRFDEGKKQPFPGDVPDDTLRGNVTHRSWSWTLSIGFVRRLNPATLPDENGPPLPTPDYYQPYPLASL